MDAPSVLFPTGVPHDRGSSDPSDAPFLRDLGIERVITAAVQGRAEYDLEVLFRTRLADTDATAFRHDVVGDLERPDVRAAVDAFSGHMKRAGRYRSLARKRSAAVERQVWTVHAVKASTDAVAALDAGLADAAPTSAGLTGFRTWLSAYAADDAFVAAATGARQVLEQLADVRYCLHIEEGTVAVARCDEQQTDFTAEVAATFARFAHEAAPAAAPAEPPQPAGLDDVELAVLERVARLHPDVFARLARFSDEHGDVDDDAVRRFDREVQFYLAYLDHIAPMRAAGLPFCLPQMVTDTAHLHADDAFDLALAHRMAGHGAGIVRNDVALVDPRRTMIITGANQGGKTTYARMVGQLHHLGALGLPVPGRAARLPLVDRLFTHFPVQERLEDLRGRLEDELVRLHEILADATADSLIILNELFGATKVRDATVLGAAVLDRVEKLGARCVFVTFLDELAAPAPPRVSMVAQVDPRDPAVRTFTVVPKPAEGRAHAVAIAEKHGLTYAALRTRMRS